MGKQLRKLLGLALSLAMCLSLVPAAANAAGGSVKINAANFPDPNFRAYVQELDGAEDGVFTPAELAAIDDLGCGVVGQPEELKIHSLEGAQYFTELSVLRCNNNALTSLDLSHFPKLTGLYCENNQLTSLDFSHNPELYGVTCENNQLTFLDVTHCPELYMLSCVFNKLPSLDVSHNPKLSGLYCAYNQITSLDLSNKPNLYVLECSGNRLTHLNIDKRMEVMACRESECEVRDHTPLSKLPGPGFDRTKVRNLKGGSFDGNKVNFTADRITYTYNFGHGYSDTFTLIRETGLFSDVFKGDWFFKPVEWAVANKITAGTSTNPPMFSPHDTCVNSQIITFIWNSQGQPKPHIENPFTDVKETDWFYQPALWAYENGLVYGEKFNPNQPCTRASTVLYLWRFAGKPECSEAAFKDVDPKADYARAVDWAVFSGVTAGTGNGMFSPDLICTRSQIATFLYHALSK